MGRGDWSNAIKLLNSPEVISNPAALNLLAWLYFNDAGAAKNSDKAFYCLKKAAKQEYWPAICNLARAYQYGMGTTLDRKAALSMYKKAQTDAAADDTFSAPDKSDKPSDIYLDECWSYCQQWRSHKERLQHKQWNWSKIKKNPEFQRYQRLSAIQYRFIRNSFWGDPIGWIRWALVVSCQSTLTAIVLYEVLPYMPGFYFLGDIFDALRLGLIFYFINLCVSISSLIAIPLYILCIAVLLYLGCDLPIIGLMMAPFMASLFKACSSLISKHVPKQVITDEFTPRTMQQRKTLERRLYWLVIIPLALVFNTLSVKIVADCFPSIIVVKGWLTIVLVAAALALANQALFTFLSFIEKRTRIERSFLGQWMF